jgi:hypothetical protein
VYSHVLCRRPRVARRHHGKATKKRGLAAVRQWLMGSLVMNYDTTVCILKAKVFIRRNENSCKLYAFDIFIMILLNLVYIRLRGK